MIKLVPTIERVNDLGLSVVVYLNIGGLYALENKSDLAHLYYEKAFEVNDRIENNSIAISLLINAGSYSMGIKDYKTAENHMKRAEKLSLQINNTEQLSAVYYGSFQLYEKMNNSAKAFAYLKKYNQQKEKILSNSKTIDSYQAYVSTFLASAEKEMMISKQKTLLEKRRFLTTLISLVFIILLLAALSVIFYQKRRQHKKKLLYEKTIQKLQEEKHKEILSIKTREVTSYSLMLSSKNDVLENILQKTKELKNSDKTDYSSIIEVIKNSLNIEAESHKFIYHFNEVHPEFFSRLKSICNELTENNLRICAYFKMGMSIKQVAAVLNVSSETVKNGRYRLKKKLKLNEDVSLDDFIRDI